METTQASTLRLNATDIATRFLRGIFRRMMNGIG